MNKDFIEQMKYFFDNGGYERAFRTRFDLEKENKVLTTKVGNYIIDSCYTFDAGYETGIAKENYAWIIVENYNSYDEMKKGHEKWCKYCEKKPKKLYSVQTKEYESWRKI